MRIRSGSIIISTPLLDGTNFEHAVIIITEYNTDGAMGFVINQLFQRNLNELVEFSYSKPFALYHGGPVGNDSLFFLHRRSEVVAGGAPITDGIHIGGDFTQAVAAINNGTITPGDIKVFIGYCGWDAGGLEAELTEGSWLLTNAAADTVFTSNTLSLWQNLYAAALH